MRIPFASGIAINAGVVGTPGLSVVGNATTGIYLPASDQLAVTAGGVQSQRWSATGSDIPGTLDVVGAVTGEAGFVGDLTGNAATATKWATARTLSITGDLAYTSPAIDGSANGTAAGTLATVNGNVGSFGSATAASALTVNAKGLVTAAASVTVTPAVGSITGLGSGVATALAAGKTGSGVLALATSPALVTPDIGAATGTSIVLSAGATTGPSLVNATTNNGAKIKQAAQIVSGSLSSTFYNGTTWENSGSTDAFSTGYSFGGVLSFNYRNATGPAYTSLGAFDSLGNFAVNLSLSAISTVRAGLNTYGNRPVSPTEGDTFNFSDSNTASFGATIAGSGSNHVSGRYNGTNWTVTGA